MHSFSTTIGPWRREHCLTGCSWTIKSNTSQSSMTLHHLLGCAVRFNFEPSLLKQTKQTLVPARRSWHTIRNPAIGFYLLKATPSFLVRTKGQKHSWRAELRAQRVTLCVKAANVHSAFCCPHLFTPIKGLSLALHNSIVSAGWKEEAKNGWGVNVHSMSPFRNLRNLVFIWVLYWVLF